MYEHHLWDQWCWTVCDLLFERKFSHWADCDRQCVRKTVDLKLWIALVKWVTCFGPPRSATLPCPALRVNYSMIVQSSVRTMESSCSTKCYALTDHFCTLWPRVWTCFLTYLNFPSVVQLLWHPLLRWRGSCPFAELYCNHFSSVNIIFIGLIVHRACNKILTLCCERA